MTSYKGNQKGFIYVACDASSRDEVISKYLGPIETEDRRFCLGRTSRLRRRDRINIAKAHALLIFLTKELLDGGMLEDIVATAVEHNKPMLLVHFDDVELDSLLTMQTDAQQALFRKRYETDEELIEEIKTAAIFDNMQVTPAQKKQQKRRIFIPLAAVTAVAVMASFIILRQSVLIPDDESANALGLPGVSERDLTKIEEIHICGNEILGGNVDCEYVWYEDVRDTSRIRYWWQKDQDSDEWEEGYTTPGEISDLSGLEKLTKLKVLELEGQQIEDISLLVKMFEPKNSFLWDLYDLWGWDNQRQDGDNDEEWYSLSLRCNPISSIDGLEKATDLDSLDISYTNVSELPEGLDIKDLNISHTKITEIPDFRGRSEVRFEAWGVDFEDISKLATAESYERLGLDAYGNSAEIIELMKGRKIEEFCCSGLQINSLEELSGLDVGRMLEVCESALTSLDGIEHFEGIEELNLGGCDYLTDISDVNKLKSLKKLRLRQDQAYLANDVDDRIEVIIE